MGSSPRDQTTEQLSVCTHTPRDDYWKSWDWSFKRPFWARHTLPEVDTASLCSPDCALNDLCPGPFPSRHQTRAPGFIPVGGRVELGLLGPALISGLQREVLRASEAQLVCTLETRPPFGLFFSKLLCHFPQSFFLSAFPEGCVYGRRTGQALPWAGYKDEWAVTLTSRLSRIGEGGNYSALI